MNMIYMKITPYIFPMIHIYVISRSANHEKSLFYPFYHPIESLLLKIRFKQVKGYQCFLIKNATQIQLLTQQKKSNHCAAKLAVN